MLRSVAFVLVTVLVACAPPPSTTGAPEASNMAIGASAKYETAPTVTPVDFNEPPDLRDKICGNQFGRGDSYDTVTKATSSFCR